MKVVVTGIGLITALGSNRLSTWRNLIAGVSGIKRHQPFPEMPVTLLGMIQAQPYQLTKLIHQTIQEAIEDANLQLPKNVGIVLGSSRGNQADFEAMARGDRSLQQWLSVFEQSPSAIAAEFLETDGPVLAPRNACATGLWAIALGADLIREGQCEVAIVGGIETPITPLTLAGFQKMGALTAQEAAPFDINRSGFVLGEGAAVLILESVYHAQARQHSVYGEVLGFGSSADAYHISAPNPDLKAAHHAIQQCLFQSQLQPNAVDFIHAHGTGTPLNDITEAKLITHLFPHSPWVTSTKGATGHTLGASGALGGAFCLLSMQHRIIPPCTGLKIRDPGCDIHVLERPIATSVQTSLCLSFGFGGQNAAIAFSILDRKDLSNLRTISGKSKS